MTFTAFLSTCASTATAASYGARLSQFDRWLGERSPTKAAVADYFQHLLVERKVCNRTVLLHHSTLAHFFDWSKRTTGKPGTNPVGEMKLACRASTRQAFTPQEIGRIIGVSAKFEWYWAPAVTVGSQTGLRLGDVATLRWTNIWFGKSTIDIMPAKTKRLGKSVEIPMTDEVAACLTRIHLQRRDTEFVFPEMSVAYRWNPSELSGKFGKICKAANVVGSFHMLRHAFCTALVNGGANHLVISSMTGHSLAQLKNYCHPSVATKLKALQCLSNDEPLNSVNL